MKLAVLLLSAGICHGFQLSKPVIVRIAQPKDTLPKIRNGPSLMMTTPLTVTHWRLPSAKVQIALAAHVVVIAVTFNILRFIFGHLLKFVQGLIQTKKLPKDRNTLEVAYARRKKEEQEKARLAAWKKGQEREAAELRAQKKQQQKYVLPEIPKPKVVNKPTVQIVPAEVSKQFPIVSMDGMNAAKKRELAVIADRKRQQAMILARPMDGINAAKRQELEVIAQRKLQQDMMARDHLSITREEEAEKNRKLTSMMSKAERDAKRTTESALAGIKAKVADVVEQRLESEEQEEEVRYAQEWAAAVSSNTKESSGQQRNSIYSVLSAVVGRGQRFFGFEEPSEEEALGMYQRKVKSQQQTAAAINARSKGLALENAEHLAMMSRMLREEEEELAIMEMEEHRQALDRALRRKEAEETAAAISYAKTVKRIEDARRARALGKGKALEQAGEYVRQPAPPAVVPAAGNIATMLKSAVGRAQRYFGFEEPNEEELLAMYQRKVKAQQQAAAVINARSKGQALETAEQTAMKSKMLHEEAEAKARMDEEEDRQARATALRRKEAEEASAAVAYAKSMKRLDEAKRQRAINKLKALEQIEQETSYVRPTTYSVDTLSYADVTPIAPFSVLERASTSMKDKTVSEQEALAMYAARVKAEQAAKHLKLRNQGGQEMHQSMSVTEEQGRLDEMEDERILAAALRRKIAEEQAAMEAYKKSVQKLELIRAGKKLRESSTVTPSLSPSSSVNVNKSYGGIDGSANWSPHSMIRA